jgi:hypothetical protein
MKSVTIGVVPRERFSLAAESLQRIFDCTDLPFNLIVVDCNIPARYRRQMDEVLNGRSNVKVIRTDEYMLPNRSRNLVINEARDEYVLLTENDVLVKDGWLTQLVAAIDEHPADVAVPLIIEGRIGKGRVHFDDLLGTVQRVETPEGPKWAIRARSTVKENDRGGERRTIEMMEQHCILFRRSALERMGPYDEELNTRDEIALSLALYHAGQKVVFVPQCEVHYVPPYPPEDDELDFFFMKWDLERAAKSRERIREKWNLVECPGDMGFVKARNLFGQMSRTGSELKSVVSPGEPFILVDDDWWKGTKIVDGLQAIPFTEHDGTFWGLPADDASAITELERLRAKDPRFIVFGWPEYFDWTSQFPGLHGHLNASFPCVLNNERLLVYELRP